MREGWYLVIVLSGCRREEIPIAMLRYHYTSVTAACSLSAQTIVSNSRRHGRLTACKSRASSFMLHSSNKVRRISGFFHL